MSYQQEQMCLKTNYCGSYRPCTEESKALTDRKHALVRPGCICLLCRGCREDFPYQTSTLFGEPTNII